MTQSETPDFEDAATVTTATDEPSELDIEVNDDDNLDVDIPTDDESDEVPGESEASTTPKPAKATRPKAPEGYVKPVEFAKILSEHLGKTVPPQVVYSYIKNNSGESAKNPFPVHEVDGYAWYVKPEEGLQWWDDKNGRVAAGKAARAEKAAKKAAVPAAAEGESKDEPITEAE